MSFNQPPYSPKPGMPPVPRDHAQASMSEIMPFRSKQIDLIKSPLTFILGMTAILGPLMFTAVTTMAQARSAADQVWAYTVTTLAGVFTAVMILGLVVFFYARPGRPLWCYVWPFGVVAVLLATPLSQLYFIPFRNILPGNVGGLTEQSGWLATFVAHFFGAGMCEELMKATPTLAAAAIGIRAVGQAGSPTWQTTFFRIRGPLDGVLMGIFAGAGFIFMETAFEYVPDRAAMIAKATGDQAFGWLFGMQLLLPRVFTGMVGHMAWSATFGYFIGLAVIRPKHAVQLVGGGWVAAATTHALWNSTADYGLLFAVAIAGVTAVMAAAVILKGRQLNQKMFGDGPDTYGSIVIDRSGGAAMVPAYPVAAPQPAFAPQAAANAQQRAFVPQPAMVAPAFQAYAPSPPVADEKPLAIDIDGLMIPIMPNQPLDLAGEPALGGRGAGVRADVVPHPTRPGVLGLRNTGDKPWVARLRDGRVQQIDRDQNLRMAVGVRLEFGDGLIGNVVARS